MRESAGRSAAKHTAATDRVWHAHSHGMSTTNYLEDEMKGFVLSALALLILGAAPAVVRAAEQDVAKISCKDFLNDKEHIGMMVMWIDGYMSGKSDNTTISDEWMEKLGTHLGTYCAKNPTKTIMDAIQAVPE